jgi:modulator of FtsH protease HflK
MSLGNSNNNRPDKKLQNNKPTGISIDELVLRFNNKIAYLLGKRNTPPHLNNKMHTSSFYIVISSCFLLLWLSTGFYYIAENMYGLMLNSGRVVKVKHGAVTGLNLPYPLGKVVILHAGITESISFSDNSNHTKLVFLTSDLHPINIDGNFSYQISDPKQLYTNYLQKLQNLDDIILWNTQSSVHAVASKLDLDNLKTMDMLALQTMLINAANQRLIDYGVRVIKINILAINQLDNQRPVSTAAKTDITKGKVSNRIVESQSIAIQILEQAYKYKSIEVQTAKANASKFSQLLIKYKQNSQQTVQEMYTQALSQIPVKEPNYSLLNLSLPQLLNLDKHLKESDSATVGRDARAVTRSRDMERETRGGRGHDDGDATTGGTQK